LIECLKEYKSVRSRHRIAARRVKFVHGLIAAAVCGALQWACTEAPAPAPPPVALQDDRGATLEQDSMRDWFIETSVSSIPGTEDEIIGMLGQPDSVVRLPAASSQDPMAYDTIIEAYFPGLSVNILKVGQNETLQNIRVADTTFVTGPITIGSDTTTLRRLLGPPMLGGAMPGYVCGMCSILNESVRFEIIDGKVTAMLFTFPGG
jgi:hypothetical protein